MAVIDLRRSRQHRYLNVLVVCIRIYQFLRLSDATFSYAPTYELYSRVQYAGERGQTGVTHEENRTRFFTWACISTLVTVSHARENNFRFLPSEKLNLICSSIQVVILLVLFAMRKSIHLVSHLFYESGKAVQAMPFIMIQPFIVSSYIQGWSKVQ